MKNGEEETIAIKIAVPHQKEYNTWADRLKDIGRQEALLLPISHSFTKEGFCGLSGTVDVSPFSFRSHTRIILSYFQMKSTTGNAWEPNFSKKTSFGTWSLLSYLPLTSFILKAEKLVMFALKTFSSVRMDL